MFLCFLAVKELCPNSNVVEGFSTEGGLERDGILFVMEGEKEMQVHLENQNWLKELSIIK